MKVGKLYRVTEAVTIRERHVSVPWPRQHESDGYEILNRGDVFLYLGPTDSERLDEILWIDKVYLMHVGQHTPQYFEEIKAKPS